MSEIESYIRIYGINDAEEREELVFFVGEMDEEYLKYKNKK